MSVCLGATGGENLKSMLRGFTMFPMGRGAERVSAFTAHAEGEGSFIPDGRGTRSDAEGGWGSWAHAHLRGKSWLRASTCVARRRAR